MAVGEGALHIAEDSTEERCTGSCPSCCDTGDRFWYQYINRALGYTDEPHSVWEIRNEAVDDGAPSTIVAMLDGLLKTLRSCNCHSEICWCETRAEPMLRGYSQKDIDYTSAYLIALAEELGGKPDHAVSFTERPGVVNICWCGQSVSVADIEELEAHSYCSPEQ